MPQVQLIQARSHTALEILLPCFFMYATTEAPSFINLLSCSVQKTYLRLLTIGLALARASAQLQDSNIPPTGRVAGGDTLSPSVL